jgi:hypothetical protein
MWALLEDFLVALTSFDTKYGCLVLARFRGWLSWLSTSVFWFSSSNEVAIPVRRGTLGSFALPSGTIGLELLRCFTAAVSWCGDATRRDEWFECLSDFRDLRATPTWLVLMAS